MAAFLSLTKITFKELVHFQRTRNCLFQPKSTCGYMFQNMFILSVTKYAKFAWFVFTLCTFVKPVIDLQLNPQHQIQKFQKSYPLLYVLHYVPHMARTVNKVHIWFFTSTLLLTEFLLTIFKDFIYRETDTLIWFRVITLSIFSKLYCCAHI